MKYKIDRFEIKDNKIKLYIKKPLFTSIDYMFKYFDEKYANNCENYLACSICDDDKIVVTFILRNHADLYPYIRSSSLPIAFEKTIIYIMKKYNLKEIEIPDNYLKEENNWLEWSENHINHNQTLTMKESVK